MPRVNLYKKKYLQSDLSEWIIGRMSSLGLKQEDMGTLLGITQQGFGYRGRKGLFDNTQLYIIFKELKATDEEILRFMKM